MFNNVLNFCCMFGIEIQFKDEYNARLDKQVFTFYIPSQYTLTRKIAYSSFDISKNIYKRKENRERMRNMIYYNMVNVLKEAGYGPAYQKYLEIKEIDCYEEKCKDYYNRSSFCNYWGIS